MNDTLTPARPWYAVLRESRLPLWVGLLLLILLLVGFAWQRVAVQRAEARQAEARVALLQQLRERAGAQADETRRHFAMSLAWAVRGELIRNNLDQVDQYFAELIRLPGHKLVVLAGADGRVLVSTDRKHLGTEAASLAPAEVLGQGEIGLHTQADGSRLLVIPVMGLNARMGTVLLRYQEVDPVAGL